VGSTLRNAASAAGHLPLTPQVFQILLSLSDQAMHGYAIIADITERTAGEIRLTASTLYDALARLVDQGLIDERATPPPGAADHDARRRYYELSALGRDVARLEASRLQRLVDMARHKNLAPASGAGKGRGRR
jgi:DNA-binding PadR family transcriptional regulator